MWFLLAMCSRCHLFCSVYSACGRGFHSVQLHGSCAGCLGAIVHAYTRHIYIYIYLFFCLYDVMILQHHILCRFLEVGSCPPAQTVGSCPVNRAPKTSHRPSAFHDGAVLAQKIYMVQCWALSHRVVSNTNTAISHEPLTRHN